MTNDALQKALSFRDWVALASIILTLCVAAFWVNGNMTKNGERLDNLERIYETDREERRADRLAFEQLISEQGKQININAVAVSDLLSFKRSGERFTTSDGVQLRKELVEHVDTRVAPLYVNASFGRPDFDLFLSEEYRQLEERVRILELRVAESIPLDS